MAMEITSNYSSYAAQGMADNTKKRAEKTSEPVKTKIGRASCRERV